MGFDVSLDELPQVRLLRQTVGAGKDPRWAIRATTTTAQALACIESQGIALLGTFVAAREPRLVPVLPRAATPSRDMWLVVHEDMRRNARVAAVNEWLAKTVADRAGHRLAFARWTAAAGKEVGTVWIPSRRSRERLNFASKTRSVLGAPTRVLVEMGAGPLSLLVSSSPCSILSPRSVPTPASDATPASLRAPSTGKDQKSPMAKLSAPRSSYDSRVTLKP